MKIKRFLLTSLFVITAASTTEAQMNQLNHTQLLHKALTQKAYFVYDNCHSNVGTAIYNHQNFSVLVNYSGPTVKSVGFVVGNNINREAANSAFYYAYLTFQMQLGKILSNDAELRRKLYRIIDTIQHNLKMTGQAKFQFDDLQITSKEINGATILALTPVF